ncbi:hypothetical protein K435DRAFT_747426 [Dendrothele bispora CBS 962.96]|uniref:Telomere-associated protein Rif1 N-terminal domain-containing protein n=1 Tax=Dendrothele bispora (strain CBS 962.96) TaxID=1314807 RepID=A0A4S8MMV3_DENBC|nr:hypothetical protein K435DRAFT_747426 [Dendrothele bispora CBS 962.96]
MSLPTPPKTSHRESKENRVPGPRVVWSQHNQYHSLSSPPRLPVCTSALRVLPARSILKKPSHPILPLIDVDEQREVTPEPSNPLHDSSYLKSSVTKIISSKSTLGDLITAYSVLTARIRSTIGDQIDSGCPLLEPLRDNRDVLYTCVVRDVARALIDPLEGECESKESRPVLLPSPTNSPRKKRCMTAEQAKYGRDLCTSSQSVLRLLNLIFTLPAVFSVFTDKQLKQILTQVLSIPLAESLPTPNARKTCAISILVIQSQRLPAEVLAPAKDRIAYCLRRGIDGELGKEGKKGSANDGLKAVHELSIYQPFTFVPAFAQLLPSILNNLLAPTLALRIQACNALSGLVLGSITLSPSYDHTRMSAHVATFLTIIPTSKPSPSKASPTKCTPSTESPICRTLRTTLNAVDPVHVAQGPVWALNVLANCIVLLGPALYTDVRLSRIITSLLALTMRHKKSSVRALACAVWRCVTWTYYQPLLPEDPDAEAEPEDPLSPTKTKGESRTALWRLIGSVVSMGSGVSTVAACVGSETGEDGLKHALQVLNQMIDKNTEFKDAMRTIAQLVSFETLPAGWHMIQMLPDKLFSASGGLLTSDLETLQKTVRPILAQCPGVRDVRPLTEEELTTEVLEDFFKLWKRAAFFSENIENHMDVIEETWTALLKAGKKICEDAGEDESWIAQKATDILFQIIENSEPETTPESSKASQRTVFDTSRPKQRTRFSPAKKLNLMRALWAWAKNILCAEQLEQHGQRLLGGLMNNEEDWTDDGDLARTQWAAFCAELSISCELDSLKAFWGYRIISDIDPWVWNWTPELRSQVWVKFVKVWHDNKRATWEGSLLLLTIPFAEQHAWDMRGEELTAWDKLLARVVDKAWDYGLDALSVIDQVAQDAGSRCNTTFTSLTRVVDMMLNKVDLSEAQEVPENFVELITDTLRSSYPPEPRNLSLSMWMIRSIVRFIELCPGNLLLNLMETMQEGLVLWISDEYQVMNGDDYELDILPLYQTIMLGLQAIPQTKDTFESLYTLLEAIFLGRLDKPEAVLDTFNDFWKYASCECIPNVAWPPKVQEYFNIEYLPSNGVGDIQVSSKGTPIKQAPIETVPSPTVLSASGGFVGQIIASQPDSEPTPVLLQSPTILSTPTKRLRPKTPPLPDATSELVQFALFRSPTKRQSSVKNGSPTSPSKRRRVEKENDSPVQVKSRLTSKKRRLSDPDDMESRVLKKARLETRVLAPLLQPIGGLVIDETKITDEIDDISKSGSTRNGTSHASRSDRLFTPSPRKRKAMLLDSVEVPSIKEINRRRRAEDATRPIKLCEVAAEQQHVPNTPEAPIADHNELISSPRIPEMLDFGSDDSMMSVNDCSCSNEPQRLSSDDDPHIGQVTPRHLTSPPLRRGRELSDPPSDDSYEPASPSRDIVLRRLKRHAINQKIVRPLAMV